jgi:glycosidase
MWGANDPCSRKPMIWDDLNYQSEKYLPDQSLKPAEDEVKIDSELFNYYKKLITIRNENSTLQLGDFNTYLVDDTNNIFAFTRRYNFQEILVILNNSPETQEISLDTGHKEFYRDLMDDNKMILTETGILNLKIEAYGGRTLLKDYYR